LKVFLDANVLFSASLGAAGTAQALLVAAANAGAHCLCSERAFAEAHRNLLAKAPQSLPQLELISALVARVPEPHARQIDAARGVGVDEKDAPVLGAALACAADCFVTGDRRHFGHLFGRRVEGVLVLPLRAAVDRLAAMPSKRNPRSPSG
jgi:predicted nucleic acid-binding protein